MISIKKCGNLDSLLERFDLRQSTILSTASRSDRGSLVRLFSDDRNVEPHGSVATRQRVQCTISLELGPSTERT